MGNVICKTGLTAVPSDDFVMRMNITYTKQLATCFLYSKRFISDMHDA